MTSMPLSSMQLSEVWVDNWILRGSQTPRLQTQKHFLGADITPAHQVSRLADAGRSCTKLRIRRIVRRQLAPARGLSSESLGT